MKATKGLLFLTTYTARKELFDSFIFGYREPKYSYSLQDAMEKMVSLLLMNCIMQWPALNWQLAKTKRWRDQLMIQTTLTVIQMVICFVYRYPTYKNTMRCFMQPQRPPLSSLFTALVLETATNLFSFHKFLRDRRRLNLFQLPLSLSSLCLLGRKMITVSLISNIGRAFILRYVAAPFFYIRDNPPQGAELNAAPHD